MSFVGIGRRRNQSANFPLQPLDTPQPQNSLATPEEWIFLDKFEQQYGTKHPFFYACRFIEAMKLAEQDHKFVFMYLHSQEHPFANVFCKETLCSELVTQFLDVNFVCWGALADRGEGLQMVASLRPSNFPCCAVISPVPSDGIIVLQQVG
jgi:FAS-associated factor 2